MKFKPPNIEETAYFTIRNIKDDNGNNIGKVVMYRLKNEKEFTYYMLCPQCKKETIEKKEFKRRPYRVVCNSCGYKYSVEKIKPKK